MKILFISNLLSPHHLSGYEMLAFDVAKSLHARGHEIQVLTSNFTTGATTDDPFRVLRVLHLDSDINKYHPLTVLRYWQYRRRNITQVKLAISDFDPDIVFIWGLWNLSTVVAEVAEQVAGSKVVYYLAGHWQFSASAHRAYWDTLDGQWRSRLFKKALWLPIRLLLRPEWRPARLRFEHAMCCSRALREQTLAAGVALGDAPIIYEGLNLTPYLEVAASRTESIDIKRLSVVYVGRLVRHKGVHTVIQAIKWLQDNASTSLHCKLTILGSGHPTYEAELRALVETNGLNAVVEFLAPIPPDHLPRFLANHDLLVLSSIYEEPLALIMQDALAAGLIVVATWTGGTKETIVDGQNGLIFQPEDYVGLAQQILRVARDPALQARLREGAVKTASEMFDLHRMTDRIEAYLVAVGAESRRGTG